MSVDKAAKGLIKGGNVSDGLLNKVEMAFRAYDPCFGCATHTLPGHLPLMSEDLQPRAQTPPPTGPARLTADAGRLAHLNVRNGFRKGAADQCRTSLSQQCARADTGPVSRERPEWR